jgi:hypothetical protein
MTPEATRAKHNKENHTDCSKHSPANDKIIEIAGLIVEWRPKVNIDEAPVENSINIWANIVTGKKDHINSSADQEKS